MWCFKYVTHLCLEEFKGSTCVIVSSRIGRKDQISKLHTVFVFCTGEQTGKETRSAVRRSVAEWSGWIMTQSWLDNKLNHILLTADSISTMSLLHSRNVFLSLLFALLDVGNNLIFFRAQSSALHLGQCIVLFPSCMSSSLATFL